MTSSLKETQLFNTKAIIIPSGRGALSPLGNTVVVDVETRGRTLKFWRMEMFVRTSRERILGKWLALTVALIR